MIFCKSFYAISFVFSCLCLAANTNVSAQQQENEFVLLHINDVHAHVAGNDEAGNPCSKEEGCTGGSGQIAKLVAEKKAANPNVLLIDGGDRLQGSLIYSVLKWPAVAGVEKYMDIDVATLGNHEFDEGCEELAKYIQASNYTIVAANLAPKDGCPLSKVNIYPYKVYDYGNFKVGVVGIANDEVFEGSRACADTVFTDPVASTQKAIDELQAQGINFIVVVSHLGWFKDLKLAEAIKGADILVGAHTHTYIGPDSRFGPYPTEKTAADGKPILIVTTNGYARFLGELKVKLSPEGKMLSWDANLTQLGPAGGNKEISEALLKDYDEIKDLQTQIVGVNEIVEDDGMEACRAGVCLTASLMTQVMLDYGRAYGAQIALINGGTVRGSIPVGEVTLGDLMTAMPFVDLAVVKEMTGEQLIKVLEHGVTSETGTGPRMLHAAGLKYYYKVGKVEGPRVERAELVLPDGSTKPINPEEKYAVVVNSFNAYGGDGQMIILQSKIVAEKGVAVVKLITDLFNKESPLTKKPEDGIVQIKE